VRTQASRRLVVGITGAEGAAYGVRLLEVLRGTSLETHLVMCDCSRDRVRLDTGRDPEDIRRLAHRAYAPWNQAARISSGSFLTEGMIVAPCSTKSLASIAIGLAGNLVHRAADVTLKEGRQLVLLVGEPPFPAIHREHLRRLSDAGAVVLPAAPSRDERSIDAAIGRLLDRFGIEPMPTPLGASIAAGGSPS
jgi:4-hydroxy-3-polyprenylbenzoate decarboxylase